MSQSKSKAGAGFEGLRRWPWMLVLLGLAAAILIGPAHAQPRSAAARCEALARADLSQVEDAPAKILSATVVAPAGKVPGYCEVLGYAWRQVQFRVRLPLDGWNGKLVVFGTGGQAGSFPPDDLSSPLSQGGSALRAGFAIANHNGGHVSLGTDALWAYQNEEQLLDYGFRAPHVAGLAARAVVQRMYDRAARLVYYDGCSNGGREALQMAQRFPDDYDGIIAGAPSMAWSELFAHLMWFSNRMYGPAAVLDAGALRTLHQHVLRSCDGLDGRRDGILDDPRACRIDLAAIICPSNGAENCLTPAEAQAAREIYDGPHPSTTTSNAMAGSELVWDDFPGIESYAPSVFRFQSFMPPAGPLFVPDEANLSAYIRRSGGSDAILSATNPDLRRFRDRGGKLLTYMGWNDPIGGIPRTLDYYAAVERLIGDRKSTQAFYRLFMVPGMNHCTGGDGAYQIDWLAALDAWRDGGKAPDAISGYHPGSDGEPSFTRTIAPFDPSRRVSARQVESR